MKPSYGTSIQFSQEDFYKKEKLRKASISIIDTWRRGADEYIMDMVNKRKALTSK